MGRFEKWEIDTALERNEFRALYKPVFSADERLIGADIKLQWDNPEYGLLEEAWFSNHIALMGQWQSFFDWICQQARPLWELMETRLGTVFLTLHLPPQAQPSPAPNWLYAIAPDYKTAKQLHENGMEIVIEQPLWQQKAEESIEAKEIILTEPHLLSLWQHPHSHIAQWLKADATPLRAARLKDKQSLALAKKAGCKHFELPQTQEYFEAKVLETFLPEEII